MACHKEDHGDAVETEKLVVCVVGHQICARRKQFHPDCHGQESAYREKETDAEQVEESDALVVDGQKPAFQTVGSVQVVARVVALRERSHMGRSGSGLRCCGRGHQDLPAWSQMGAQAITANTMSGGQLELVPYPEHFPAQGLSVLGQSLVKHGCIAVTSGVIVRQRNHCGM